MVKKVLAGAIAGVVMLSSMGVSAYAQDMSADNSWKMDESSEATWAVDVSDEASGDFSYTYSGSGITISKYTGSGGAVVIPDYIDGVKVTVIGERAFENSAITSLTISNNVTSIGYCAFYNCDSLESVKVSANVYSIANSAFGGCKSLTAITVDSGNPFYKSVDGVLFNMSGSELMTYPGGKAGESYTVPASVNKICESAFDSSSNLVNVKIPDSVTYISDYAFANSTSLKEIKFPKGIDTIFPSTCYKCSALEKVVIQEGVTYIHQYAFGYCMALKEVTLPKSLETIASYGFNRCWALKNVYYAGSEADWANMYIYSYNDTVKSATKTYNYVTGVQAFVERMYTIALNRSSDAEGLNNWVTMLEVGSHDGAGIAAAFLNGDEFKMRGLSNGDFVDVLYRTFFNREADSEGRSLWVATLDAGFSREYVLSQFVNLDEFKLLCASYDIERGIMFADGVAAHPGISKFVNRLYATVLGREADSEGLYNWALALTVKSETAKSAATNFFGSAEYTMKNVSNDVYVSDLYAVFMNRAADTDGMAVWVTALNNGMSREQVLESFAGSEEFKIISASYGL